MNTNEHEFRTLNHSCPFVLLSVKVLFSCANFPAARLRVVAQVSKPAVSPISKSAGRVISCHLRVWKPAIRRSAAKPQPKWTAAVVEDPAAARWKRGHAAAGAAHTAALRKFVAACDDFGRY